MAMAMAAAGASASATRSSGRPSAKRIEDGGGDAEEDADGAYPEIVQAGEAKDPEGVLAKGVEVRQDKEQARADERGEDGVEAETPDFVGVQRETPGEVDTGGERGDEGERGEGSVGGDGDVSELEETGMHC